MSDQSTLAALLRSAWGEWVSDRYLTTNPQEFEDFAAARLHAAGVRVTGEAAGCGGCKGWPGHHPDCSLYGIPRTEAGARLLATLENSIYRGTSPAIVARAAITEIEDEAEVRAANRGVRVTGDTRQG